MTRFILRRLISGAVLIFVISGIAFVLLYASGGDIARRILGRNASAELVSQKASALGLDRSLWAQYTDWLSHAVRGDFGRSWFTGELVATGVTSRLAVTLSLIIGATLLAAIVALVLGLLAATRGGWVDRAVQVVSVLGFAIPGFLVALALVLVFAVGLKWFKATGYIPITTSFTGWVSSVTLPILALALVVVAALAQQIRGSVKDTLNRDYIRTLRARGLGPARIVGKHVLRNAGGPALAVLAIQFIGLLGGAVIVEQVFAIPGLGQLAVNSTVKGDIPVVMGLVTVTAIVVVVVNVIIDIAQAAINPKVRLS
ncbi:ABC transporter permease [Subtercola frigoramans]|uniref:Peptide/nickel transport system permease protein n=1 Tax=Subtercola frigoramans TaxID=120298 RepID=A0ABS2L9P7_9MICO|nr:ABC transporter permease [Subtercola frigoramans]MBM7473704.1 peptide/nickel transport system permease protein [Subtercola frigoramans]